MSRAAVFVWLFGITQIVGYGTLYYSFSALAPSMAKDLDLAIGWVYGAFSLALLAGGLVSPFVGRALDRYGAGSVMTFGSLAAAAALALCAAANGSAMLAIGLVAIEATAIVVQYEAAFAALVQLTGTDANRRITHLTLIAGFASTIFWPLTTYLHDVMSWREVYFWYAGLHVVLCFPIHLWIARQPRVRRVDASVVSEARQDVFSPSQEQRAFGLLLVGFSLVGFVISALLVHMIPLLTSLGLGSMSAVVGAVFGPAQVFSRVVNMGFGKELHPLRLAMISAAMMVLALGLLAVASPWLVAALMFSALFGLGSGLTSIVRGTVPLALFGPHGYGARVGKLTSARLILSSVAPFAFAMVLDQAGPTAGLCLLMGLGTLAVVALWIIDRWGLRSVEVAEGVPLGTV